jgi:hypothetical protein
MTVHPGNVQALLVEGLTDVADVPPGTSRVRQAPGRPLRHPTGGAGGCLAAWPPGAPGSATSCLQPAQMSREPVVKMQITRQHAVDVLREHDSWRLPPANQAPHSLEEGRPGQP